MKESDPSYRALIQRKRPVESAPSQLRKRGGLKIARQEPIRASTSDGPALPKASPTVSPKSPSPSPDVARPDVRVFPKTPRCPACDSGMDVPGIGIMLNVRESELHLRRVKLPLQLLLLCLMLGD